MIYSFVSAINRLEIEYCGISVINMIPPLVWD